MKLALRANKFHIHSEEVMTYSSSTQQQSALIYSHQMILQGKLGKRVIQAKQKCLLAPDQFLTSGSIQLHKEKKSTRINPENLWPCRICLSLSAKARVSLNSLLTVPPGRVSPSFTDLPERRAGRCHQSHPSVATSYQSVACHRRLLRGCI